MIILKRFVPKDPKAWPIRMSERDLFINIAMGEKITYGDPKISGWQQWSGYSFGEYPSNHFNKALRDWAQTEAWWISFCVNYGTVTNLTECFLPIEFLEPEAFAQAIYDFIRGTYYDYES